MNTKENKEELVSEIDFMIQWRGFILPMKTIENFVKKVKIINANKEI